MKKPGAPIARSTHSKTTKGLWDQTQPAYPLELPANPNKLLQTDRSHPPQAVTKKPAALQSIGETFVELAERHQREVRLDP